MDVQISSAEHQYDGIDGIREENIPVRDLTMKGNVVYRNNFYFYNS
jgi:hypothetical protein